ncbi:hypothetical protein B484DRAFT_50208 [Ochromonadaceae sp. CCMP2298]|nr:hypothetical protein B484DRAFT_50208 [Ochromonadaceae sp. CCMP2298]
MGNAQKESFEDAEAHRLRKEKMFDVRKIYWDQDGNLRHGLTDRNRGAEHPQIRRQRRLGQHQAVDDHSLQMGAAVAVVRTRQGGTAPGPHRHVAPAEKGPPLPRWLQTPQHPPAPQQRVRLRASRPLPAHLLRGMGSAGGPVRGERLRTGGAGGALRRAS